MNTSMSRDMCAEPPTFVAPVSKNKRFLLFINELKDYYQLHIWKKQTKTFSGSNGEERSNKIREILLQYEVDTNKSSVFLSDLVNT